jgi:putative membrane protein
MSRKVLPFAAMLLAFVFACRKPGEKVDTGAAGNPVTDTSTTTTSGTDTSGTTTTSTAASATTTGSTGATVSNLSAGDKEFVMKAAQGGMAEVQLGQTAQSKASDPNVQSFAKKMVDDHSKANDELKQLATTKGLAVPADLDAEHKKVVDDLSKKSGKDFDKAYMKEMVGDHEKTASLLKKESSKAQDADLKNWASKILPTVEEHLRMAKDTQKKLK